MSNTIGWGKGSENNDIGWGQGAVNNDIGWGAIQELSYSGETNIVGGLADNRFIMVVKSDNAGTSGTDQFTIPTTGAGYLYDIETSDGFVATGVTGNHTITFPSGAGTRTVFISGDFPKTFFNNVGDKLKVLEVTNWGIYGQGNTNQANAFNGCSNIAALPNNALWFGVVTSAGNMFVNNSITSLPPDIDFTQLSSASNMFSNNSLASLNGMKLPALVDGALMFNNNSLTSLPNTMELPLLSNGNNMFSFNALSSLPSGMTLSVLTNGNRMFLNNSITSLPTGMELPLLTNGNNMFQNNSLTSLPAGMELPLLTTGTSMFVGNTINTTRYSQLLVDLESGNANNSVTFHGGNSKYNATGETARDILTGATRLWTITDGGLE